MNKTFLSLSVIAFGLLLVISFASALYIYEKKSNILSLLKSSIQNSYKYDNRDIHVNDADIYWAEEIMNGGYILHFRYAERDKWIDVNMYDSLESDVHSNGINQSRYAEND